MSDDKMMLAKLQRRQTELNRQISEQCGRVNQILDDLREDPEHVKMMRNLA